MWYSLLKESFRVLRNSQVYAYNGTAACEPEYIIKLVSNLRQKNYDIKRSINPLTEFQTLLYTLSLPSGLWWWFWLYSLKPFLVSHDGWLSNLYFLLILISKMQSGGLFYFLIDAIVRLKFMSSYILTQRTAERSSDKREEEASLYVWNQNSLKFYHSIIHKVRRKETIRRKK